MNVHICEEDGSRGASVFLIVEGEPLAVPKRGLCGCWDHESERGIVAEAYRRVDADVIVAAFNALPPDWDSKETEEGWGSTSSTA